MYSLPKFTICLHSAPFTFPVSLLCMCVYHMCVCGVCTSESKLETLCSFISKNDKVCLQRVKTVSYIITVTIKIKI